MGRKAEINVKNGYWHSSGGGRSKYFGRVDKVSYEEATANLSEYLKTLKPIPPPAQTLSPLAEKYIEWMKKHRSKRNWVERARHLTTFGGRELTAGSVERWKDELIERGFDPSYVNKHLTSVRAMVNRAMKMGWLPNDFQNPFDKVELLRINSRSLRDDDLLTQEELHSLVEAAKQSPYADLADLITLYYNTGARTHELLNATISDFHPRRGVLVLDNHKRSHTMKEPRPRTIKLNATAMEIVSRRAGDRPGDSPLFPSPSGGHYSTASLDYRFARIREAAGVNKKRTPYGFRHLFISEMLMSGVDPMVIARACGTSVNMVERVYGHYRVAALSEAQGQLDALRARHAGGEPTTLKLHA